MSYIHNEIVHNKESSKIVFPILLDYIKVNSVLDVGCGLGTWLSVASDLGIKDVFGVDGDYVDRRLLTKYLNLSYFKAVDLRKLFDLKRSFDLAICLEVAEHLPEISSEYLIDSLIRHSDCILFSAAIPGQGGQNHLNEQWPDYWQKLFSERGFVFLDIIRPVIWNNPNVDYWYKQNVFLVVKRSHPLALKFPESYLPLVHPELLERLIMGYEKRIKNLERNFSIHPLKKWIKSLVN